MLILLWDLQGQMETLRERLDAVASTASASVDQAAMAGSSALTELQTQHFSYAQSAQQACPVFLIFFALGKVTQPAQGMCCLAQSSVHESACRVQHKLWPLLASPCASHIYCASPSFTQAAMFCAKAALSTLLRG